MTKDEALKLALKYVESTQFGGPDAFELLDALRGSIAQTEHDPELPDTFGVMFAVERAVENGHAPWDIVSAFEEYEEARKAKSKARSQS